MDGLTLFKFIHLLKEELEGGKLNRISAEKDILYLSIFKNGNTVLEYRTSPTPPCISIVQNSLGDSPGILSHLAGAKVEEIGTHGYDRIAFITISKRKPSGKLISYKLIFEVMGNYANFFILDDIDTILYSLSSRTIDPDRNIGISHKYIYPKANKRFDLDSILKESKSNSLEPFSFDSLIGFYKTTSKYADDILKTSSMQEAVERIKESLLFDANFYLDKNKKVIPFKVEGYAEEVSVKDISKYFAPKVLESSSTIAKNRLMKIYEAEVKKSERLIEKLNIQLKDAKGYEELEAEAMLLKNNLYKKPTIKGDTFIYMLDKYEESGITEVRYELKYPETITEKSNKLFKKASRFKKAIPYIENSLQEAHQLLLSANEQLYFINNMADAEIIALLQEIGKKEGKQNKNKDYSKESNFHKVVGNGYTIYIGKNSLSNYNLTLRFANNTDIWLHAKNIPSAHAIIRLEGATLTDEILTLAGSIVAHFSKYSNEKLVDIDYTQKKHISKPKNSHIGFVLYHNFKTITVKPLSKEEVQKLIEKEK